MHHDFPQTLERMQMMILAVLEMDEMIASSYSGNGHMILRNSARLISTDDIDAS